MSTCVVGRCKCGAYGVVFNEETEAKLGRCHDSIADQVVEDGNRPFNFPDREFNAEDCLWGFLYRTSAIDFELQQRIARHCTIASMELTLRLLDGDTPLTRCAR